MVLKLECASESLGGLIKTQVAAPTPRYSGSVDHGNTYQAIRIAIRSKKVEKWDLTRWIQQLYNMKFTTDIGLPNNVDCFLKQRLCFIHP